MSTPEGAVKKKVKALLKKEGIWSYMPIQNGMGVVGIPDLIACVPLKITPEMVGSTVGVFAGIETKAPGKLKNTTPNQRRNLHAIGDASGVAIVADGTEIVSQAIDLLRKHGVNYVYIPV